MLKSVFSINFRKLVNSFILFVFVVGNIFPPTANAGKTNPMVETKKDLINTVNELTSETIGLIESLNAIPPVVQVVQPPTPVINDFVPNEPETVRVPATYDFGGKDPFDFSSNESDSFGDFNADGSFKGSGSGMATKERGYSFHDSLRASDASVSVRSSGRSKLSLAGGASGGYGDYNCRKTDYSGLSNLILNIGLVSGGLLGMYYNHDLARRTIGLRETIGMGALSKPHGQLALPPGFFFPPSVGGGAFGGFGAGFGGGFGVNGGIGISGGLNINGGIRSPQQMPYPGSMRFPQQVPHGNNRAPYIRN